MKELRKKCFVPGLILFLVLLIPIVHIVCSTSLGEASPSVASSAPGEITITETVVFGELYITSVYYVSPSGNDGNDGLSWENAKRTIENAINTASSGDTIRVADGTYAENLVVDKENLTIMSENGPANCIVQTPDPSRSVFSVTENNVKIIGFTVENATGSLAVGIYLFYVENCLVENNVASNDNFGIYLISSINNTLSNNTCSNNYSYGIWLWNSSDYNTLSNNTCENNTNDGIFLEFSSYNNLSNNTCSGNDTGIYLRYSFSNTLTSNICEKNSWNGIWLWVSSYNNLTNNTCSNNNNYGTLLFFSSHDTLTNNTFSNNRCDFEVWGSDIEDFDHDIDTSNLVNGKPIYYLKDTSDLVIGPPLNAGYFGLVRCDNIRVENLVFEDGGQGILLAGTENSLIENCVFSNNDYGICLVVSSYNTLTNNTFSNNNTAIYLRRSSYNNLTSNTCSNNGYGIFLLESSSYNNLANNTCENSYEYGYGILLISSSYNTLTNNTCSNNYWYGIYSESSSSNTIFHNYLLNNTENNAYDDGTNYWDNGSEGNYWSDWQPPEHPDADNNGIVDEPRPILGGTNQDSYPLTFYFSPVEEILTPHDPIHIEGDDDFTPANGVVGGSGTAYDPYIIENWMIDASSAHGIWIQNTTKYFIIRNCLIGNGSIGIYLWDVINGKVENNICSNNRATGDFANVFGIFLVESDNNIVSNNICDNNYGEGNYLGFGTGICLNYSSNCLVSNNTCENNGGTGLWAGGGCGINIGSSSNDILDNNICENNSYYGIYLYWSSNNTLSNNTCENSTSYGICLNSSSNNNLTNNTCENDNCGIYLSSSNGNIIFHNYLLNNIDNNAYDDGTNYWDNGSEGNYWSDWQPPEHSDADGDGIVDEPRPILGGTNQDSYPLVLYNTPAGTNVEVVASDPDTGEPTNVTVTFENVTAAGDTTAKEVEGAPPAGYELFPENIYYDINTTAEYTGTVTVAIYYGDLGIPPEQESGLQLMKLVDNTWTDITTRVDTENDIIYGETTELSLFALMRALGPREVKEGAIEELEGAKTGVRSVDRVIDGVISFIERSLEDSYWVDELHLDSRRGDSVFTYEGLAVGDMELHIRLWERRDPTPEQERAMAAFEEVMPELVKADELLARRALREAHDTDPPSNRWKLWAYEQFLARGDKAFERALKYSNEGRPKLAILSFKRAWKYAQLAIKLAQ